MCTVSFPLRILVNSMSTVSELSNQVPDKVIVEVSRSLVLRGCIASVL